MTASEASAWVRSTVHVGEPSLRTTAKVARQIDSLRELRAIQIAAGICSDIDDAICVLEEAHAACIRGEP